VSETATSAFLDHYRCPEGFAAFHLAGELSEDSGYFRFGPDTICFGHCSEGFRTKQATDELYDTSVAVAVDGSSLQLPFNPSEIVANLRYERYAPRTSGDPRALSVPAAVRKAYYWARPLLPVSMRKHLQQAYLRDWDKIPFPHWPVDPVVERIFEELLVRSLKARGIDRMPFIWFWPGGAPSCAVMTHDVESESGRDFCGDLMDLDDAYGIKASFQIVPEERYTVSERFLSGIRGRGFEVNIHDLNHDGHLFSSPEQFLDRAERINQYGRAFGAAGFRSAVLYRNLDWFGALDFSYDMSVPSVGHLEPQRGGCCSVTPFFIGKMLELPVTTTQDYSLFHILNQYSIDLWKREIALITKRHGLVSFITHPDYLREPRARTIYMSLLAHLARLALEGTVWCALPRDVNQWWRERSQMRLTRRDHGWEIEGPGHERARLAYAHLEGDHVRYSLDSSSATLSHSERIG
jgi:hypothetical protein